MLQKACELLFQPSSISSESSTDQSKRYGTLIIVDTYRSITKKNWISKDDHVDLEDDASTDKCPSNLQNASRLIRWLPIMESIGFKLLKHEVIHDHRLVQNRISSRKKTKKASIGLFFRTMTLEERSQRSMTRKFHTFSSPKRPFSSSSNPPHLPIGIIGAGIGGSALAFILHQQGIPYLLFDRDEGLSSRPQGYAVTIQQGISVLRSIGIITSVVENKYNRNVSNVVDHAHVTNGLATEERDRRYPIIIPHCTISRSHVSFDQEGKLLGVFGPPAVPSPLPPHLSYPSGFLEFSRDSHTLPPTDQPKMESSKQQHSKNTRQNIHMPRQALRDTLLTHSNLKEIKWGHKFEDCDLVNSLTENTNHLKLRFHNHPNEYSVSGLVGCDGIYSNVRKLLYKKFLNQGDWNQTIQKPTNPESFHERNLCNQLNYLGLFVILGISPRVDDGDRSMTRRKVQWVDGVTRVFSMPYDDQHDMWQMSFPMTTQQILQFHPQTSTSSSQRDSHRNYFSSEKLKELALKQCHSWHTTLTAMLERTEASLISGHPVYDQHPTDLTELKREAQISHLPLTLLGDSWHPMSPFKAQGANQALLDALSLSKQISQWWRERRSPLGPFFGAYESEAYDRSAKKVLKSRLAAQYLHSPVVMTPGNVTRASVAEKASQ
jgi:2-polyprenyl-6-methoxyphenol hydroxylase-like FAD-dependent oxidoreductase